MRSHIPVPLTELTGKRTFSWMPGCDKYFAEMKAIVAEDALNAYPNHNLRFYIYTDASDYQMDAAIIHNGCVVAYWIPKLIAAQRNYTTMEKELLAVVC